MWRGFVILVLILLWLLIGHFAGQGKNTKKGDPVVTHFVHMGGGIILVTIAQEADRKCEDCGKAAETRPYGKGGMHVCFQCAMKDEAEARRQYLMRLGMGESSVRH